MGGRDYAYIMVGGFLNERTLAPEISFEAYKLSSCGGQAGGKPAVAWCKDGLNTSKHHIWVLLWNIIFLLFHMIFPYLGEFR